MVKIKIRCVKLKQIFFATQSKFVLWSIFIVYKLILKIKQIFYYVYQFNTNAINGTEYKANTNAINGNILQFLFKSAAILLTEC